MPIVLPDSCEQTAICFAAATGALSDACELAPVTPPVFEALFLIKAAILPDG